MRRYDRRLSREEIINAYRINNLGRCTSEPETIEVIISDIIPDKQSCSPTHLAYLKIAITILVYVFIGILILWLFGAFGKNVENAMGGIFMLMIISTIFYRISKASMKKV